MQWLIVAGLAVAVYLVSRRARGEFDMLARRKPPEPPRDLEHDPKSDTWRVKAPADTDESTRDRN